MRWTIGDAAAETIERLEASLRGVHRAFGPAARAAVCVHSVPVSEIRERVPSEDRRRAIWLQVDHDLPVFVRRRVGVSAADGVAWRFAPLRVFTGRSEVVVANGFDLGCVAVDVWGWATRIGQRRCLVVDGDARDLQGAPDAAWPSTILARGVPASFDLEDALEETLSRGPEVLDAADALAAELAAVARGAPPITIRASAPSHARRAAHV